MLSYTIPKASVQQVLLKYHEAPKASFNLHVQKVLNRLRVCRTAALGYHVYRCSNDECGEIKYQYHSCRDRHCPQCGEIKKDEWIEARMQELLGHSTLQTTMRYMHLSSKRIEGVVNPYDVLMSEQNNKEHHKNNKR